MHQVTIYSTPSCHYCNLAKDYFKKHNVEYTEYNVAADPVKRTEMVNLTSQLGVPVITIDDSVIVGFNEEALTNLLAEPVVAKAKVIAMDQDDHHMAQAA